MRLTCLVCLEWPEEEEEEECGGGRERHPQLRLSVCVCVCVCVCVRTWVRRALRLGGALMAAVSDLLGEGLEAEKKEVSDIVMTTSVYTNIAVTLSHLNTHFQSVLLR